MGCASKEILRDLPSAELLRDCPAPVGGVQSNGQLAELIAKYDDVLAKCNIDKKALREWAEGQP